MSVLVTGMDMPRHCGECGIDWCDRWKRLIVAGMSIAKSRPSDCPLVEVPTPHGRLIDADAFSAKIIEIVERQKYDDSYAQSLSIGAILREVVNELKGTALEGYANAPTIIPASGGKEDE